jgi:hypothetical protein
MVAVEGLGFEEEGVVFKIQDRREKPKGRK